MIDNKKKVVSAAMPLFQKLFSLVPAALFLLATLPVFAHNMAMGSSRWCFGKDSLVATIELDSSLMAQIRGMNEVVYSLAPISDEQLQEVARNVVQPYLNSKLSISVNNTPQPVKVDRIVRVNERWTIWLAADGIRFAHPENRVRIDYRLLFEETYGSHINIAYLYLSDAAAESAPKIFNDSVPKAQHTFLASSPTLEVSVKGAELPALGASLTNAAVAAKSTADIRATAQGRETQIIAGAVTAQNPVGAIPAAGQGNRGAAPNPPKKSMFAKAGEFLVFGVKHIFSGYDHILFLLALIVIGLSFREVLKIITAFTIAHSLTLLLAALRIISLNSRFVEIVIAFSICYVAVENLFRKEVRYRWLVTFAFGLVHGFGFASALQELIVGKSDLLVSVLSFNLGVEAGQIMIFLLMLPILRLLRHGLGARRLTLGASAAVLLVAFTWLIERVFALKVLPI